ncbi:DNA endonuclease RBBP8 isoform X1 [Electrophorus electricus]|uniref:DNA endonuclease RBBP8 n=1 Tax=Electrophorus electricus TaxID=8005 RepID=A0A4W4GA76_ELEEL|nr:DNA endonuclease RBBP8 isoform X1 [Electrophorus electricus]
MTSPQFPGGHENSPGIGGTPAETNELFHELLNRLRVCHDNALQGLQLKVTKLKKERYLDAQRLEEFYNRNQHLREEQRNLQDSITLLKDRLKSAVCDRCRETERERKKTQAGTENQNNLPLINEIKAERDILREENRKLRLELKQLRSEQTSFVDPEEVMIPDSPLQPMSFPVVSKLKRKRDPSHVRYAERPLSQPLPDLQKEEYSRSSGSRGGAVLVPETCDLDVMHFTEHNSKIHGRTVVAETCRLDLHADQDSGRDGDSQTLLHHPLKQGQEEDESSVSTTVRNASVPKPKSDDPSCVWRRLFQYKACPVLEEQDMKKNHNGPKSSQQRPGKMIEHINIHDPCEGRSCEPEQGRPEDLPPCSPCKSHLASQNCSPCDQSWSVDPGAALSQYGTDNPTYPEPKAQPPETVDMDCTYVSHSLLIRSRKQTGLDNSATGIGLKANDSLANIFDTTGEGEYESCPQDDVSAQEQEHVYENEPEEEGEEEEQEQEQDEEHTEEAGFMEEDLHRPSTQAGEGHTGDITEKTSTIARVEVVRKKNERRKLQGHTCKECEIYYAGLPAAERKKKLSSCSRHRFRYIPPATPENFWEVGFPSTQTCIERGYVKEDNQVDPRMRRRRPYLAMFSPKAKASKI